MSMLIFLFSCFCLLFNKINKINPVASYIRALCLGEVLFLLSILVCVKHLSWAGALGVQQEALFGGII